MGVNKIMENLKNRTHSRGAMMLSLGLLLMLVAQPSQAEFYKWTDESGQVHYTQTPPPEQSAEKIRIDTHTPTSSAIPPTKRGEVKSCGSITLPAKRLDPMTNIVMFRQAIAIWQKYLDENSAKSDAASRQGVTDRRCAIEYANKELQALNGVEQDINTNYERVRDELEALQEICSTPPDWSAWLAGITRQKAAWRARAEKAAPSEDAERIQVDLDQNIIEFLVWFMLLLHFVIVEKGNYNEGWNIFKIVQILDI